MAATRGREFVGSIFLIMIYMYYRTVVQSFMLSSKTARLWCLAAPLEWSMAFDTQDESTAMLATR